MSVARFIEFHRLPERELPAALAPVFAVTLARGPAGVVLVFNRYRKVWELPGGFIDAGESAHDAARRELAEEAECPAGPLEWLGVVEVEDDGRRCGAVFGCDVPTVPAHVRNAEVDGIAAWTPAAAPQPMSPSDRALLDRLARTGPPESG
jgi:8-oxo-dGTP diphosphatase